MQQFLVSSVKNERRFESVLLRAESIFPPHLGTETHIENDDSVRSWKTDSKKQPRNKICLARDACHSQKVRRALSSV